MVGIVIRAAKRGDVNILGTKRTTIRGITYEFQFEASGRTRDDAMMYLADLCKLVLSDEERWV